MSLKLKTISEQRCYSLKKVIGSGSFGKVFLALSDTKDKVALKVFNSRFHSQEELKITQNICCSEMSGIVSLLDYGIIPDDKALKIGARPGSIFLVYSLMDKNLKTIWNNT